MILKENKISILMDIKGISIDNIVIEHFQTTLKYEDVYLKGYEALREISKSTYKFIHYYNTKSLHSSIEYNKLKSYNTAP